MKFQVIYADPAWQFTNAKTGGSHTSGASQKYPTMPLSDILSIPVQAITAPAAVLFLWVPTRLKFSHGQPTAHAWGFESYETTIYWDKQRLGMGFWYRNVVEELLVFTRGPVAPFRCQLPNILHHPPMEHSEKPEVFRRHVEESTGQFSQRRCVELFARRRVTGWTGAGNGVTGRDIRTDIRLLSGFTEDQLLKEWGATIG